MASQGSSSNSRLVAVGAVVLLLGVILVLLILRGSVGGDEPVADPVATDGTDDADDADPAAAEDSDLVDDGDGATVRVPLPLEVEDGFEAVTLRVAFGRGLAALPEAGDRVALYEVAADPDDGDGEEPEEDTAPPTPAGDAERILDDVEVLGVVGPRPAANDGTLTFVVALEEDDVPAILPLARDEAIWFTLLPGGDEPDDGDGDGAEDGS